RVTGRSRFTGSPGDRSTRLVRSSVSGDRSKLSRSPSRATTVRHTPFTAIESPGTEPGATLGASTTNRDAPSTTVPRSSTIPVNIRHHLQILTHPLYRTNGHRERRSDGGHPFASEDARRGYPPNELGGEVKHQPVYRPALDGRPANSRSSFDQDRLDVSLSEDRDQAGHGHPPLVFWIVDDQHIGARRLPGVPRLGQGVRRG